MLRAIQTLTWMTRYYRCNETSLHASVPIILGHVGARQISSTWCVPATCIRHREQAVSFHLHSFDGSCLDRPRRAAPSTSGREHHVDKLGAGVADAATAAGSAVGCYPLPQRVGGTYKCA